MHLDSIFRLRRTLPVLFVGSVLLCWSFPAHAGRRAPTPLTHHPGNVFLEGEQVEIQLPSDAPAAWQVLGADDKLLSEVRTQNNRVSLGRLPVGFYRLKPVAAPDKDWVSFGVLAPLRSSTPRSSPVALDVAASWFYPEDQLEAVANLCALAGINRVRDRLSWGQMEPQRGRFARTNIYDAAARVQRQAGLQVLQVHHDSPGWANPDRKRFPLDLRDAYQFSREMARRWAGQVCAFEPWNEADITTFGGHTGSEMASLQKAAYLGLKAGNPDLTVCMNVFALNHRQHLEDLQANEAWPYFDTFNLHHYKPFEQYPKLYADFRAVSAGRPLWVSECALPVKWAGEAKRQEPSDADLHVQAQRVAKTFALSLHEGSTATFYFMLPHYVEGETQFGLLRRDLTPRPGFVALAAVGRLLADARPLGRVPGTPSQQAYFFRASPDGHARDMLVAWDNEGQSGLSLPKPPQAVFDYLGRSLPAGKRGKLNLTSSPIFAVFPERVGRSLNLTSPPTAPSKPGGKPSTIVLQAIWPEQRVALDKSAYRIRADQPESIPVFAYNFGSREVQGRLEVTGPSNWRAFCPQLVVLPPGGRQEMKLVVEAMGSADQAVRTVRIAGEFGKTGRPVLSLRLIPEKPRDSAKDGKPVQAGGANPN
jgi:hypothetical protein